MNTTVISMMTNNIDYKMCHLAELSPFIQISSTSSSFNIVYSMDYIQMISIFIASIFTICSMLYACICKYLKPGGYTLHLVGIPRPSNFSKSKFNLFENINTDKTLFTISTSLKQTDTISHLKSILYKTYQIADNHGILIVFAHHIITNNDAKLQEVGIKHNSLLTLAICVNSADIISPSLQPRIRDPTPTPAPPVIQYESESESETDSDYPDEVNSMFEMYEDYESEPEPVTDVNVLFGMFKDYETDSSEDEPEETPIPEPTPIPPVWPRLGFDIITQENDVLVHKMPCGHEMNQDSLYQYALNTFNDSNNIYIKCPHSHDINHNTLCNLEWEYNAITDILTYNDNTTTTTTTTIQKDKWMDYAKLELLSARNVIENKLDVQKCPHCNCLYYQNYNANKKPLEEIKTVEDIENEFKFECILCNPGHITIIEQIKIKTPKNETKISVHNEDEIEEDIDGDAVNRLFGIDSDDDEDEDDYKYNDEEDNHDALIAIKHMFDDDFSSFIEEEKHKYLNGFCWCCGEEWLDGHICDSTFKQDLVDILAMSETQTIGSVHDVPSIRCCPNCCQLIFHTEACKHMECSRCHTDFCFVCLKPTINGNWQCGSHCDVCPVHPRQDMETLPDTIVLTKKLFQLY